MWSGLPDAAMAAKGDPRAGTEGCVPADHGPLSLPKNVFAGLWDGLFSLWQHQHENLKCQERNKQLRQRRRKLRAELEEVERELYPRRQQRGNCQGSEQVLAAATMASAIATMASSASTVAACSAAAASLGSTGVCMGVTVALASMHVGTMSLKGFDHVKIQSGKALHGVATSMGSGLQHGQHILVSSVVGRLRPSSQAATLASVPGQGCFANLGGSVRPGTEVQKWQ